ncbi:MAG: trigger factor [Microgenomates group bacterium LiPW_16]|nr:MAG: trigger factor [Microgenomates group bacterium LiPW_16]
MTVAVNRLVNGTIELTITIPWNDIKTTYEQVVEEFVKEVELPGFRKGKAPRKLVEEKLDKSKVYEEVLKQVVPKNYAEAIKQENLTPIVSPRIEVISFKENEVCQFRAQTCEKPQVSLGNYQETISKLKREKQTKIWVPGKDVKEEKPAELGLEEIIKVLLETSQVNLPTLLVEDEVNRMLARLIDQTQKLGLTVEQYLLAQGKTIEGLKAEYKDQAARNLALEFILEAIADNEKIQVSDEEIEKVIKSAKDTKEQEALRAQKYYLATILRRQKTLDRLAKPIV